MPPMLWPWPSVTSTMRRLRGGWGSPSRSARQGCRRDRPRARRGRHPAPRPRRRRLRRRRLSPRGLRPVAQARAARRPGRHAARPPDPARRRSEPVRLPLRGGARPFPRAHRGPVGGAEGRAGRALRRPAARARRGHRHRRCRAFPGGPGDRQAHGGADHRRAAREGGAPARGRRGREPGGPDRGGAARSPQVTTPARIQTPDALPEEDLDRSLRPKRLEDFVGQDKVKRQLAVSIEAAARRGEPLDHVLFAGPPGLGKTSLAGIVAAELGAGFVPTAGPALERKGDVAAFLTALDPGSVFFVDELHRLPRALEETFYPAMEDGRLPITVGQGAGARVVTIDLPPFTLIGATTRAGLLTTPLR